MTLTALAAKVDALDVRSYLEARRWVEFPSRYDYMAIYRTHDGKGEVVIPLDRTLADYAKAIATASKRIAEVESRAAEQVLRDLLHARTDIVRFALIGDSAESGSVDVISGAALAQGSLHALRASASSIARPKRFHPRMTLTDSEAFVKACRFGQTEIGSFVLTVQAPLEVNQISLDSVSPEVPFGRRTTCHLIEATQALVNAIKRRTEARLIEQDNSPVSANLCDAIVTMAPRDESLSVRISSSWSPAIPAPDISPSVIVERTMFEKIATIGDYLRPTSAPKQSVFVGRVTDLHGEPGPDGLEGDVTMRAQVGSELLTIKYPLGPSDYHEAVMAHASEEHVCVRGTLNRRARSNFLTEVSDFKRLEYAQALRE